MNQLTKLQEITELSAALTTLVDLSFKFEGVNPKEGPLSGEILKLEQMLKYAIAELESPVKEMGMNSLMSLIPVSTELTEEEANRRKSIIELAKAKEQATSSEVINSSPVVEAIVNSIRELRDVLLEERGKSKSTTKKAVLKPAKQEEAA